MKMEYLMKHANKVNEIMRKVAYPYGRCDFINLNDIEFEIEESSECLGYMHELRNSDKDFKLMINECYFDNMYKRKYDKKLISTLAHEMIHIYIAEWFDSDNFKNLNNLFKNNFSSDSSPIFLAMVKWFELKTGLNIGMNRNLRDTFDKFLKRYPINFDCGFNKLIIQLFKLRRKVEDWLIEVTEELKDDKKLFIYKFNNYNVSFSNIVDVDEAKDITIITIALGMEELLDKDEFVNYVKFILEEA